MDRINNFDSKFEMYNHLHDGDCIPTGEKPILADISQYEVLFKSCEAIANLQKKSPHFSFGMTYRMCEAEAADLEMSPSTYSHIQIINTKLAALNNIPSARGKDKSLERQIVLTKTMSENLGKEPVQPVKLSTLVNSGLALCSEYSILAQAYLEKQGIDSYICSGGLLQATEKGIISEKHHFLAINDNGKMYIYDPLNKKSTGIPRVVNTHLDKDTFLNMANNKDGFILDVHPDLEEKKSVFDIGDTHHLGYAHGKSFGKNKIIQEIKNNMINR